MVPVDEGRAAALAMLVERLRWPEKMVRLRAAKEIRALMISPDTRDASVEALLTWMKGCDLESEVLSALSVLVVAPSETLPAFDVTRAAISRPSIASDFLLQEIYGRPGNDWLNAHSGSAPSDFEAESYFHEHKGAHVPGHLLHELEFLEERSGLPFTRQWAFEWTRVRENVDGRYTRYPSYFGDFGLQREGIFGQFILRQSEIYRSAHQRTLACAVSDWGLPLRSVATFALYGLPILPDLFEVEPIARPAWLPKIDSNLVQGDVDVQALASRLIADEPKDDFLSVNIRAPLDKSFEEFGEFEIAAFFMTEDFKLSDGQELEKRINMSAGDGYRFDGSRDDLEIRPQAGSSGIAIPVCCDEFPALHGFWHGEYYQRGLSLPAQYCFSRRTFRRANSKGLTIGIGGEIAGTFQIWHDAWNPLSAPNTATRCGGLTRIRRKRLDEAAARLGMKVGWFARFSRMHKPAGKYEVEAQDLMGLVMLDR